jgi:hypothetical protein
VVFELTDVDEDGCLSPDEIAKMIEVIERIFAKENGDIELRSRVLMESLSKEKAKRRYDWAMRSVGNLEAKCMREEGLVTYKEFYETICMMPNLKKQFLPRYLDLKTILTNATPEPEIYISDLNRDDFVMFRYEMHALLSKGLQPKSKGGMPVKKIDPSHLDRSETLKNVGNSILAGPTPNRSKMKQVNTSHKECPGLIKVKSYSLGPRESKLPNGVWEYNSNVTQGYVRKNVRSEEIEVEIKEKSEMIQKIVPKREAEIAMEELEQLFQGEEYKYLSKQDEAFELDTGEMVAKNLKKRRTIEEQQALKRTMPKNYYALLR